MLYLNFYSYQDAHTAFYAFTSLSFVIGGSILCLDSKDGASENYHAVRHTSYSKSAAGASQLTASVT